MPIKTLEIDMQQRHSSNGSLPLPSVEVMGVPLFDGSINDGIELIEAVIRSMPKENRCVSATGAHGMVYGYRTPAFKKLLQSFFINLPDGMPGVWVARKKGAKQIDRCYGPDFFEAFMRRNTKNIRHFLCGGREGVAQQLQRVCAEKFRNLEVVGTYTPPFLRVEEYDYEAIAEEINRRDVDVVWIGLSTPKQEQFAHYLAQHTQVHFIVAVGAAFDFHVGNVRQAPSFMQRAGLEWFFRLCMEPRRLAKRYAEIVPLFMYYNAKELLTNRNKVKQNVN